MNMTSETIQKPFRETSFKWAAGGSAIEAIGALAAMALAIVGLAGILSVTVAAIATIILGAAILTQGGAFTTGAVKAGSGVETRFCECTSSASFLGGMAGIVLGVLALLNIAAPTLLATAVIVFGATFFLGGGSMPLGSAETPSPAFGWAPTGGEIMVGLATMVLGILAVVGLSQLTLVLVALLCLGASALFAGGVRSFSAVKQ